MPNPFFSVIITTYNRSDISNAINSVFQQTFKDYEIIVIDDHSIVPAINICEKLKCDQVQYYYLDQNVGPAGARNIGIEKSRGMFIAFLDDDDIWYSRKLEIFYSYILELNYDVDILFHDAKIILINEGVFYLTKKNQLKDFYPSILIANNIGGLPLVVIKRQLFLDYGSFNEKLYADEDYELLIRFTKKSKRIKYINEVLIDCNYFTKKASVSKNIKNRIKAKNMIDIIYSNDIGKLSKMKNRSRKELFYADLGYSCLLNCDKMAAADFYFKAFLVKFNFKYFILLVISLFSMKTIFYLRSYIY